MSLVHVIVIKGNSIYFGKIHYNQLPKIKLEEFQKDYLDAGFIVIDHNHKSVLDAQNAFPIQRLNFQDFLVYSLVR